MASNVNYRYLPWIASLAFFMQTLDISILNTALPSIATSFQTTALHVESAVVCYTLSVALFIPVSGFLADKYGTRNTFILAVFIFTTGSICSALSQNLLQLNISRIFQGIGGAMIVPISRLVLLKTFKKDEFLNALNTSVILGLIGPFLGPLLGGYLSEKLSWHWIFLINIPIGILGIIFSYKLMPNIKVQNTKLDLGGLILVSLSFISIILSLELITETSDIHYSINIFFIGIFLFIAYCIYCKKNKEKETIFPISLFKIRSFKSGIIGNVTTRMGAQAIPFLIPLILQLDMGYSAIESGVMLMPLALAAILIKKSTPRIIYLLSYKKSLILSTIFVGIAILALSMIKRDTPPLVICVILFIIGLFNSIRFTGLSSITLADLPDKEESSGNSMMAVSQQLGITLAIALSSLLVRLLHNNNNHSLLNSFSLTFLTLGLITIVTSTSFLILSKNDGNNLFKK